MQKRASYEIFCLILSHKLVILSLSKEDVEKKSCEQNNIEVATRINLCVSVLEGGKNENEKESFHAPICVQLTL